MIADFFRSQMDYIFFFYGLAFILLVPVCQILNRKPRPRPPWGWLALFGATHGINEWLDMAALFSGSYLPFDIFRLGLMALSFIFLVEFGRATMVASRNQGPGRWILVPLLFFAVLGGFAGLSGLSATSRYALGLVGGLWTAAALYLTAGTTTPGKRALQGASLGMAVYALATGVVVSPAPFLPASIINADTFFAVAGLPIQLVRGLAAVWISVFLWFFARASLAEEIDSRTYKLERRLTFGAVTALILLILGGWLLTQFLGSIAAQEARTEHKQLGHLLKHILNDKMGDADRMVQAMAGSPWLFPALVADNPQTLQEANSVLDRYSQGLPASVCYLMNRRAVTIASSNRDRPDSFVGKSCAPSPYFQRAIEGSPARYFTLEPTSKERGYYSSFPVRDTQGKIVGVAAIKRSLDHTEALLQYTPSPAFFIDPHGIVFLSNRREMLLKSLWPLSPETARELMASRQFGEGPFTPILNRKPADGSECLLDGQRLLFLRQVLTPDGWSVVLMGSSQTIALYRMVGIAATLLMCLVTIIVRDITDRKQAEEQLQISLRKKEMLLRELHHRVKNNLQVISSLLSLQARTIENKATTASLLESQRRIDAIGLVHERLYRAKDLARINLSGYIQDLVGNLFISHGADPARIKLKITVAEVLLGIDTAIPLGLILNDLVSNCLKHAFPEGAPCGRPGGPACEIRIDLHPAGDGKYLLTVSDNGVGFPQDMDFLKLKTLSLNLVTKLVGQVKGTIEFESGIGAQVKITFAEIKYKPRGYDDEPG